MKIIKPGVLNTEVLCGTCERCGCEVEVDKSDLKNANVRSLDAKPPFTYVDCPTKFCGEQIWINAK